MPQFKRYFPSAVFPALSIPERMRCVTSYTGKNVCIAMIDSGFVPHPDLTQPTNRIVTYYDAVHDVETPLPQEEPKFYSWHGTMTACTAAGNGFLSGGAYTSLAPNAKIVLIRTMHDRGNIPTATIAKALEWLIENHEKYSVNVVNISVYADEYDLTIEHPVTALVEKLVNCGVVVVAASGNDPSKPLYPPAPAPSAITVGGLNDKNKLNIEEFDLYPTSHGRTIDGMVKPEVIAPAIWLPAPILHGTVVYDEASTLCALDAMSNEVLVKVLPLMITHTKLPLDLIKSNDVEHIRGQVSARLRAEKIISSHYKHVDGTSFAAPIVCSVIAQMIEANRTLKPKEIKEILVESAQVLANVPREPQGYGVIQAKEAISQAEDLFQYCE